MASTCRVSVTSNASRRNPPEKSATCQAWRCFIPHEHRRRHYRTGCLGRITDRAGLCALEPGPCHPHSRNAAAGPRAHVARLDPTIARGGGPATQRDRRAACQGRCRLEASLRPTLGAARDSTSEDETEARPGHPSWPQPLARPPRTPDRNPRFDPGGTTLSVLRPATCLHRRADDRTVGHGTGAFLRVEDCQEEVRLPALRRAGSARRATVPDSRSRRGWADRQGTMWPRPVG